MNDENGPFFIFIIAAMAVIITAIGTWRYNEQVITKAAISAGLQQCVNPHSYQVLWQKECSQ